MSRKRRKHETSNRAEESEEKTAARAPQRRGEGRFGDDDRPVEERASREARDQDDAIEREHRVARKGPLDESEEAEVADEDILEEIDIGDLRHR